MKSGVKIAKLDYAKIGNSNRKSKIKGLFLPVIMFMHLAQQFVCPVKY